MLSREVSTLESVQHPFILRLFEVVETLGRVHLVTEFIQGGELYYKIVQNGVYTESKAVKIFKQLSLAIQHMVRTFHMAVNISSLTLFLPQHHLGYVHRDVKAENVLVITEEHVKLGDFGFSTQVTGGQYLNTFCGSPPYASPELFNDDHYLGGPVDIWVSRAQKKPFGSDFEFKVSNSGARNSPFLHSHRQHAVLRANRSTTPIHDTQRRVPHPGTLHAVMC